VWYYSQCGGEEAAYQKAARLKLYISEEAAAWLRRQMRRGCERRGGYYGCIINLAYLKLISRNSMKLFKSGDYK